MIDGKFRVDRVLGVGGMGVVLAAHHLGLNKVVAVKMLRADDDEDGQRVERFVREARAASRLDSDHVVRVFDIGAAQGFGPYIVMELLEGVDLADYLLARGELPVEEAVEYALQACEGMRVAHAAGILHRDLKPANLFLSKRSEGRPIVKVLDFGVAKQTGRKSIVPLTGRMIAVGSPQYMSPEQLRASDHLAPSTDVWALGVCLYEMLTGTLPFTGENVADVAASVLKDAVEPPHVRRPAVGEVLSRVVMRCLEKDPEARTATMTALAADLSHACPGARPAAVAPPAPSRERSTPLGRRLVMLFRRNAALRAAAAVGASAAVTALVWALFGPPSSAAGDPQAAADAGPTPSAEVVTMVPAVVHPSSVAPALQPTSTDALATAEPHAKGPKLAHHTPAAAPSASHTAEITTTATPPPPPPFDLATARVDVGAATDLVGTTSANITRALGGLPAKATSCYRQALPSASAPLEGPAKLTLETDEDGVIVRARVSGVAPGARCVEAAAAGRRVSNVDTGRARATVPLVFRAR